MNKNNPMSVKFFTFKTEFQARGAQHIHGTLWLDLLRIEKMIYSNGKLLFSASIDSVEEKPFQGIKEAFKKLRNDVPLNKTERSCLTTFADEFITVTTDKNTVGEDVANIAKEVNTHNHTKTCRKYSSECRFNYPKFPSPHTLIAKPLKETGKERERKVKKINATLAKVKEFW